MDVLIARGVIRTIEQDKHNTRTEIYVIKDRNQVGQLIQKYRKTGQEHTENNTQFTSDNVVAKIATHRNKKTEK